MNIEAPSIKLAWVKVHKAGINNKSRLFKMKQKELFNVSDEVENNYCTKVVKNIIKDKILPNKKSYIINRYWWVF